LARHFLAEVSRREQLPMLKISEEASQILTHHNWPGNVRELRGLMRQMTWKAQGQTIEPHHLPSTLNKGRSRTGISGTLEEQLDQAERNAILSALQQRKEIEPSPHACSVSIVPRYTKRWHGLVSTSTIRTMHRTVSGRELGRIDMPSP